MAEMLTKKRYVKSHFLKATIDFSSKTRNSGIKMKRNVFSWNINSNTQEQSSDCSVCLLLTMDGALLD